MSKQGQELRTLAGTFFQMASAAPDYPSMPDDNRDIVLTSAGIFKVQLRSVANLLLAVAEDIDQRPVLPSCVKEAISALSTQPATKVENAMTNFSGAKSIWHRCRQLTVRTAKDDIFVAHLATSMEELKRALANNGSDINAWVNGAVQVSKSMLLKLAELAPDLSPVVVEEGQANLMQLIDSMMTVPEECNERFRTYVSEHIAPTTLRVLEADGGGAIPVDDGENEQGSDQHDLSHLARNMAMKVEVALEILQLHWASLDRFCSQLHNALGGPLLQAFHFFKDELVCRSKRFGSRCLVGVGREPHVV